ncbi:MAG: glycoside hydrolase family 9 protein [Bacteroidales bacterium]|nr:glycoside hydrolase family 9 protein [Bacteroidales bacterium]
MLTKSKYADDRSPSNQRNYGMAGLMRHFDGEDWTPFNRISVWVYPDLQGWNVVTARLFLYNEGNIKIPGGFYPVYQAAQTMQNRQWNQIVWEITDLPRDRVTGIKFEVRRQGNEPQASDTLIFDIDQLELQLVDPDQYEGWNVAPEHIAFSHTGYQTGTVKKAIASDLTVHEFQVIKKETGQSILTKQVQLVKTQIGEFQVMDFSEIREPGYYIIQAGNTISRPFRIDDDVWRETIWKAINFFYVERCGMEIPGIHRICHSDWTVVHNGRSIVINGGWHDAGDLSQGLINTAEAVYAMFSLADRLRMQNGEDILYKRLIEEAKWGLDWVNKSSFGDGYRCSWATMGLWTNGILGDNDDITSQAQNSPHENFQASAAEAIAARILRDSDPGLASDNLQSAIRDFRFAVEGMPGRGSVVESASIGVLAAIDLYKATDQLQFKAEAKRLGKMIIDCQQHSVLPGLQYPITGFFYTSPAKGRLQQYSHRGHEQAAIMALAKLCDTFPDDVDWIRWYTGVVLHSEFFQKKMAEFTEPYRMLPNSIHEVDEYLSASEENRENVRQQIQNGIKVGTDWYIRVYPVQPQGTFRGNYGTMLSQAKAISTAAQLRGSLDLAQLAEDQLHWVVGRNPFSQSTMYGEGYDYQQLYSAMSGDIVGALPVGIKSRENFDVPYWPGHNHPNYKEVWVHPVSRWLALMADLAGPAVVEGQAEGAVEFRDVKSGITITVTPDIATGQFSIRIPEGTYLVRNGIVSRTLVLLPASLVHLDLRLAFALDTKVHATTNDTSASVTIEAMVNGKGVHHFRLLTDNLSIMDTEKELNLDRDNIIRWQAKITETEAPWVAVIVIDGNITDRHELVGLLKPLQ